MARLQTVAVGAVADATLQVGSDGATNAYSTIGFGYSAGTNLPALITYKTTDGAGSSAGSLGFYTRSDAGTPGDTVPVERLNISAAGLCSFSDRIHAIGGVSFGQTNTTAAGSAAIANILDHYEEGTWTPTITFATPGDSTITHSTQQGRYTRIGNLVSVMFDVRLSAFTKGTASGNFLISGLPFTATGASTNGGIGSLTLYQAPFTSQPIIKTENSTATLGLYRLVSNAAFVNLDDPDANSMYWGSVVYEVA